MIWNSPHSKGASNTYDPENHHTFWHQHISTEKPTEITDRQPSHNKDLLREYLSWLSERLFLPPFSAPFRAFRAFRGLFLIFDRAVIIALRAESPCAKESAKECKKHRCIGLFRTPNRRSCLR
ncbi:hypothetical protein L6R29_24540 [Myxococcota bacterium]|nr:hypothetical protein [Myxococcota bacterium]